MKASDLITKAERAVASAKLLFNAGDVDGACNRAYYAMFDAALLWSDAPADAASTKTHSGLILLSVSTSSSPGTCRSLWERR